MLGPTVLDPTPVSHTLVIISGMIFLKISIYAQWKLKKKFTFTHKQNWKTLIYLTKLDTKFNKKLIYNRMKKAPDWELFVYKLLQFMINYWDLWLTIKIYDSLLWFGINYYCVLWLVLINHYKFNLLTYLNYMHQVGLCYLW